MGLTNITGIFSRFFVVGFYLPSFFASFAVYLIFDDEPKESKVLVVGGAALLVALLASGFRNVIWFRIFSGYYVRGMKKHMIGGPRPPKLPDNDKLSVREGWNRFRRATVKYRRYVMREYGLDTWIAWPFIEAKLTEREQELHTDALATVHFFQNMSVGAFAVGIACVVGAIVGPEATLLGVALGCLVLTYGFYLGAVGAVAAWGENKIVAAVTHRHELYLLLGLPLPATHADEIATGDAANEILYGPPE